MEWLDGILAVGLGFFIRIGIPVIITVLLVRGLRRLDDRWQAEAQDDAPQVENIGCWEMKECPAELRATCKAYSNPDIPCWQVFRDGQGGLKEGCLGCEIFRGSPVPASISISH